MALGKTIAEIRALPYPEFRAWQLFYLIEPFGFADNEYRTASLLAMLYNANRGKGKAKGAKEFMRDMEKSVMDEIQAQSAEPRKLTREEIEIQAKRFFGIS